MSLKVIFGHILTKYGENLVDITTFLEITTILRSIKFLRQAIPPL